MIDAGILRNVDKCNLIIFLLICIAFALVAMSCNADVAGPAHHHMDCANIVADVNCKGCKTPFGWKFVEVPRENITVAARRFLPYLNKLLMWDGKDMLNADTYKPVENA